MKKFKVGDIIKALPSAANKYTETAGVKWVGKVIQNRGDGFIKVETITFRNGVKNNREPLLAFDVESKYFELLEPLKPGSEFWVGKFAKANGI